MKFSYYIRRLKNMSFKNMFDCIEKVNKRSKKNKIIIFFDMIICSIKYSAGYSDYAYFKFEELNAKQRKTYITRGINNTYIKTLNNPDYCYIFDNKIVFNKRFNKFLKRDYLDLSKCSLEEFIDFSKKHKEYIVKPVDADCGVGVEKIEISKEKDLSKTFNRLKDNNQILAEEYVHQIKEINDIYPYSVNTIRIVSARVNNKTSILFELIRIGNSNNVVDNFHHGGMYAIIENGVIVTNAVDKDGNQYESHPMTKTKIKGFKIPKYDEVIKFIEEASKVVPEVGMVGWDVAITKDGPVMIEGNNLPAYDFYQSEISTNKNRTGLKPKFDAVIFGGKNVKK